jgi:hypothetical protein
VSGLRSTVGWRLVRRRWYRTLEAISPEAYLAWNRRFPDRFVVGKTTGVMVEGYPSAANSAVRETFALTQPGISVASHLHSATHVHRALALGVPVLIVLRPPVDSIASIMARFPDQGFRPAAELRRYERFYTAIAPLADRVALSRFEDTVDRLGTVIRAMNSQLGTRFVPFADRDPGIVDQVRAVLDGWSETRFGDRAATATARPSDARRHTLDAARATVRDRRYARRLASCERLHADLSDLAAQRLRAWISAQEAGDRK